MIPTPAQVETLADAIDPRMWTMVRLSGYCGLRQGECLALVPENIDRLRRRIRVEASPQLPASYAGFGDARGGIVLRHDVSERG